MPEAIAPRRALPILLLTGFGGILLASSLALWVHYGTAVFFEMIRNGFVACFG